MWLYLIGKLQVYGHGVQQRTYCYGFVAISFMWVLATYVAVTRLNDQKHFIFDVWLGAFIGFATSFLAYFLYFQDPRIGGEPLRRPDVPVRDILCCKEASLQQPWPRSNTHLPPAQRNLQDSDETNPLVATASSLSSEPLANV